MSEGFGYAFEKWYVSHTKRVLEKFKGPGWTNAVNRRLHHPLTAVSMTLLLFLDIVIMITALSIRLYGQEEGLDRCEEACSNGSCVDGPQDFLREDLELAGKVFSWMSAFIICLFGAENILQVAANITTYFCSFYNILDFCIIWLSIVLEFTIFSDGAGIIILARAWRFIRDIVSSLVNGVTYGKAHKRSDRILDPKKLEIIKKLSSGNFGETFLGKYEGNHVVVKVPHEGIADVQELIACINIRPHPNVVSFRGIVTHREKLCPVTRYYNFGSIDKLHNTLNFHHWPLFIRVAMDIAKGIRHLHEVLNILHRDIRCANIFLEGDVKMGASGIKAVIGDWGLTRQIRGKSGIVSDEKGEQQTHNERKEPIFTIPESCSANMNAVSSKTDMKEEKSTPNGNSELYDNMAQSMFYGGIGRSSVSPWPFTAPEAWIMGIQSPKSDIYMIGVTLWELLTKGADPYNWQSEVRPSYVLHRIMISKQRLELPITTPLLLYCIVRVCLDPNPTRRPSASELVAALLDMSSEQNRLSHKDGILEGLYERQRSKAEKTKFLRWQKQLKNSTRGTKVNSAISKLSAEGKKLMHGAFVADFTYSSENGMESDLVQSVKEKLENSTMTWSTLIGEIPTEPILQKSALSLLENRLSAMQIFINTAKHFFQNSTETKTDEIRLSRSALHMKRVWEPWTSRAYVFDIFGDENGVSVSINTMSPLEPIRRQQTRDSTENIDSRRGSFERKRVVRNLSVDSDPYQVFKTPAMSRQTSNAPPGAKDSKRPMSPRDVKDLLSSRVRDLESIDANYGAEKQKSSDSPQAVRPEDNGDIELKVLADPQQELTMDAKEYGANNEGKRTAPPTFRQRSSLYDTPDHLFKYGE